MSKILAVIVLATVVSYSQQTASSSNNGKAYNSSNRSSGQFVNRFNSSIGGNNIIEEGEIVVITEGNCERSMAVVNQQISQLQSNITSLTAIKKSITDLWTAVDKVTKYKVFIDQLIANQDTFIKYGKQLSDLQGTVNRLTNLESQVQQLKNTSVALFALKSQIDDFSNAQSTCCDKNSNDIAQMKPDVAKIADMQRAVSDLQGSQQSIVNIQRQVDSFQSDREKISKLSLQLATINQTTMAFSSVQSIALNITAQQQSFAKIQQQVQTLFANDSYNQLQAQVQKLKSSVVFLANYTHLVQEKSSKSRIGFQCVGVIKEGNNATCVKGIPTACACDRNCNYYTIDGPTCTCDISCHPDRLPLDWTYARCCDFVHTEGNGRKIV